MMQRSTRLVVLVVVLVSAARIVGASGVSKSREVGRPGFLQGRRLEDAYADDTFEYNDLSTYSVAFQKCQLVKSYDDEFAQDEDSASPLATKHFVVYRLCPSDTCETSCEEKYGTYVTEVDTYLQATIEYQTQAFQDMCDNCDERCNENGGYCSGCGKLCYNYENLEAMGYVDAAQYIECQQLDWADDDGLQLYIGPNCSSGGEKIQIGLFSDQNCWEPYTDLDVEEVLGAKLSYHVMSHASVNDGNVCLSCQENDEDANEADQADYDDVNEMCENLYYAAAKCESTTGIQGGFIQVNREEQDYENQVENEFMACTFIHNLLLNSYTETGEIDISVKQDIIIRKATPLQILSLSLLSLSLVGLASTIVYIQKRIDTQFPNRNNAASFIANQGGQMV
jgi:hypothetical protein